MRHLKLAIACFIGVLAATQLLQAAPTVEQYLTVMTACSLGSKLSIDNSTREKVRLMLQDGVGQGRAEQVLTTQIATLILGSGDSPLYSQYVKCMRDLLVP